MKGIGSILLFIFTAFCLLSCRTVTVGTYEKKENLRPAKLIENAIANNPNYHKASYKFSAEYTTNGSSPNTFSGNLRVCHDSVIWLSIRSFNIEGFRVLVSPDSIKVMDRINNRYYAENVSAIEKFVNISMSYNDLQSILLNEFFCYQSDDDTAKMISDYKSCLDTTFYCVSNTSNKKTFKESNETHANIAQTVKILPETFRVKNLYIEDMETGRNAFVEYDKFVRIGDLLFPQTMNIYVESGDFAGDMKFSISDFELNEDLTFPFKIPSKYTKTELNEKNR